MYKLKFLILPIQNLTHALRYWSGNRIHSEAEIPRFFSLSATQFTVASHFDVLFIIITPDERQNVVIKSNNVFTSKTTNKSYLDSWHVDLNQLFGNSSSFFTLPEPKTTISLCHARMSRYRHPSSFWCRIKRPCTHWNFEFHPFKIGHTSEYLSGNRMHSAAEI